MVAQPAGNSLEVVSRSCWRSWSWTLRISCPQQRRLGRGCGSDSTFPMDKVIEKAPGMHQGLVQKQGSLSRGEWFVTVRVFLANLWNARWFFVQSSLQTLFQSLQQFRIDRRVLNPLRSMSLGLQGGNQLNRIHGTTMAPPLAPWHASSSGFGERCSG